MAGDDGMQRCEAGGDGLQQGLAGVSGLERRGRDERLRLLLVGVGGVGRSAIRETGDERDGQQEQGDADP